MRSAILDPLAPLLPRMRERAGRGDIDGRWPREDLDDLAAVGAMRWMIPAEFGGEDRPPLDVHLGYEAIASASLATALVLSQRDSAAALVAGADPTSAVRRELLETLARNEAFTTIGIAQLTTSRQGGKPALAAEPIDGGYRLDGLIPWSTGAAHAAFVVAGAVLPDGRQILFALPMNLPGVTAQAPMPLVALRATWTGSVTLAGAFLDRRYVLRGPVEKALAGPSKGVPLGQAFLAMGLCRGAIDLLDEHRSDRGRATAAQFAQQLDAIRAEVLDVCEPGAADVAARVPRLRGACNDLSVRVTHAAVALYKGTALLADHPAQRLAREAMFLLVWSCPDPVIECTVEALSEAPTRG